MCVFPSLWTTTRLFNLSGWPRKFMCHLSLWIQVHQMVWRCDMGNYVTNPNKALRRNPSNLPYINIFAFLNPPQNGSHFMTPVRNPPQIGDPGIQEDHPWRSDIQQEKIPRFRGRKCHHHEPCCLQCYIVFLIQFSWMMFVCLLFSICHEHQALWKQPVYHFNPYRASFQALVAPATKPWQVPCQSHCLQRPGDKVTSLEIMLHNYRTAAQRLLKHFETTQSASHLRGVVHLLL